MLLFINHSKEEDAYQVHKYRNYTLKGCCVLGQSNVEVLNQVLRWAGLEKSNKSISFIFGVCVSIVHLVCLLADLWKPVAGDLLFSVSDHCRVAQSVADKHTCRHN